MQNNEHLPIFREYDDTNWSMGCTCGYNDPYLFSTKESAAYGWLDHVVDASVVAAKLTDVLPDRQFTVGIAWEV